MSKIRVLVVDDSVVARRLLVNALSGDPDCEVVGAVANGRLALSRIPQVNPDVVTLDVEMPELDGLQTLAEIRKTRPKLPVIMFSALTERAADATLRALALGANDYVTKPSAANAEASMQQVREQLLPKVRAFGRAPVVISKRAPSPEPPRSSPAKSSVPPRVDLIAIGCSTGGPNALAAFFADLPANLGVPIVIVQHMPPVFTRLLAERLTSQTSHVVVEAKGGEALEPGRVFIAPGDHHLIVAKEGSTRRLALNREPPENSCRPAVDVLFRSVAGAYGPNVLALVMTGMGQDGLVGCRKIREAGGQVVVQDEATSVVWGMPGFVAQAGLADVIVPLNALAPELARRVTNGGKALRRDAMSASPRGDAWR
ncbi:MAG TPA: chemotaxis response regulator protein-glutamate methylesterase [Polyangiaceae bacterium]|jgi:two-component system chemotaxis response regulator CheB|nr:chemotaxis response regulator protein-glutamate methylesterase [Polyangiaceae bacterium]